MMTIDYAAPARTSRQAAVPRPALHAKWSQIRDDLVRAQVGDLTWQRLYAPSAAPPPIVAYGLVLATAAIALILIAADDSALLAVAGLFVAAVGLVIGVLILVGHREHEKEYAEDSARVAVADEVVAIVSPATTAGDDPSDLEHRLGSQVGESLLRRPLPLDRSTVDEALALAQQLSEIAAARRQGSRAGSRLQAPPAERTDQLDKAAASLIPRVRSFSERTTR